MALKNHALDDRILDAARGEFLEKGYEAASLRKIAAQADVTVGAIYTRYPTKDALFCALAEPLIQRVGETFQSVRSSYYDARPERLADSMAVESEAILHLLFDDYDRAVLLLCRSAGSSLEGFFDRLVEHKIRETQAFFRAAGGIHPEERVLRLLVRGQFQMYIDIIRGGYDFETAREMIRAAIVYHTGGWLALLQPGKDQEDNT